MRLDYLCFKYRLRFRFNLLYVLDRWNINHLGGEARHSTFLKWVTIDGYTLSGWCKDGPGY